MLSSSDAFATPALHGNERNHDDSEVVEDEVMPWEERQVPTREKLAEWLNETGVAKWLDLVQIIFRYVVVGTHTPSAGATMTRRLVGVVDQLGVVLFVCRADV